MIKFAAQGKDGTTLVGFGLSEQNVEKLKAGQPIHVEGSQVGLEKVQVLIFYGKTEKEMYDNLKSEGIDIKNALIDIRTMREQQPT